MKIVNYQRRQRLRRIRFQEIRKLRAMLPQTARSRRPVNELQVVNDAIDYINQLHSTIIARVRAGTLSPDALEVTLLQLGQSHVPMDTVSLPLPQKL